MASLALLLLLLLPTSHAIAQTLDASVAALEAAKRDAKAAAARSVRLEAEAAAASSAAARLRAQRAAVAGRVQSAEKDIAAAQARIALVDQLRARQRARLADRQGPIVRLAAALQVMARRPPALALIQPGSLADLVHVRALMAAELPLVQARTAGLRVAVAEGNRLRLQAQQAYAILSQGQARLQQERAELIRLEARQRIRSQALTDQSMFETDRAVALGEQARDIVELMGEMDRQAVVRERLASLPGPSLRPPVPGHMLVPPPDPLPAGVSALPYRLPVIGRLVTGLGEISTAGVRARGLSLLAAPASQIVSPAPGRVTYAGPFRGYGRIVILDHGGGWTSLITSLDTLSVAVGDQLDRGSPLGRTASRRTEVTVELRHKGQPIDITRLVSG